MSIEIWNHDYNPWLISNNPGAVVLNDHWIPMIINENWSQKLQSWKSSKSNFEVEKFLSREISKSGKCLRWHSTLEVYLRWAKNIPIYHILLAEKDIGSNKGHPDVYFNG